MNFIGDSMCFRFVYFIFISALLTGCNTVDVKDAKEVELLAHYQLICDKAIANNYYDDACVEYTKLAAHEPYVYDTKITKIRNGYIEYRMQLEESGKTNTQLEKSKKEAEQVKQYQLICEEAIVNKSYDKACDEYTRITRYKPYSDDDNITKIRDKIVEYRVNRNNTKSYSTATVSKMNNTQLCSHFHEGVTSRVLTGNTQFDKNIVTELNKRGFHTNQINQARSGKIAIGMPTCIMYATIGKPNKENKTVNAYRTHIQHVYRGKNLYVYTDNGIITSWQDHTK